MTRRNDRPIFLVSSPRSGSTLLRLILDAHPRIAIPPPGYLFNMVFPYLYSYGNLEEEENLKELVEDILETPTIKKWSLGITVEQIVAGIKTPDFKGIYEYIHLAYAGAMKKERWGNKSPRNGVWIHEIKELFPGAQFIHLLRDGRDVAIDIADAPFWPHSLWGGAQRWQECVHSVQILGKALDPESYLEIRYEDLCRDPETILKQVCSFLNEEFIPDLLQHHHTKSTKSWSQDFTHMATAKPITTKYIDMYKTRLNDRDRSAIEALLQDTLKAAGYPVKENPRPISFKLAAQLNEGDMVSQFEKAQYKGWHRTRRKMRRERGVWKDADRDSFLWGLD